MEGSESVQDTSCREKLHVHGAMTGGDMLRGGVAVAEASACSFEAFLNAGELGPAP